MRRRLWILVAILATLAALAATRCTSDPPLPPPPPPDDPATTAPAAVASPLQPIVAPPPDRQLQQTEAPPPPVTPVDLDHPHLLELRLRFVDSFGLPVPGALVFAAPPRCGLSLWPHASDARGELRLQWRAKVASMPLTLLPFAWGILQPLREPTVHAGRPQHLTVVLRGRAQPEAALRNAEQRTAEQLRRDVREVRAGRLRKRDDLDILCGRTQVLFREFDCTNCHDQSQLRDYELLARSNIAQTGLHPHARFADLGLAMPDAEVQRQRARLLAASLASESEPTAAAATETAAGAVRGRVLATDGRPVPNAPVACLSPDGAVLCRTTTDASGDYLLAPLPVGRVHLRAGGGPLGVATDLAVTIVGAPITWQPRLLPANTVSGLARDDVGGMLIGWNVELETPDGTFAGLVQTDAIGRFVCHEVPSLADCLLWSNDRSAPLPTAYLRTALPDGQPQTMAIGGSPARVRVTLQLPDDCRWAPVEVRLLQLESGRMARLQPTLRDNQYSAEGLPRGTYRLDVGAPILGWVEAATIDLNDRGLWDLGSVALPAPGRLRIETAQPGSSPFAHEYELLRRLPELDARVATRFLTDGTHQLAAGEHVLLWRNASGVHARTFMVSSGATTVLRID